MSAASSTLSTGWSIMTMLVFDVRCNHTGLANLKLTSIDTPAELRLHFDKLGWSKVVAFQTRCVWRLQQGTYLTLLQKPYAPRSPRTHRPRCPCPSS